MNKKQRRSLIYLLTAVGIAWLIDRLWDQLFVAVGVRPVLIEPPQGTEIPGKKVIVGSVLQCGKEKAWELLETVGLLQHLSWPFLQFRPLPGEQLPAMWRMGQKLTVQLICCGVIPLGEHTIEIERLNPQTGEIQSRESNRWTAVWNHRIVLEEISAQQCLYLDEVELHAGRVTDLVALAVRFLLRYRQTRWQALARRLEERRVQSPVG